MINQLKDDLQQICVTAWFNAGGVGTVAGATGVGKSRIPLLILERLVREGIVTPENRALLAVPTEKLRDDNWPAEFRQWGMEELFTTHVKAVCYASLAREKGNRYPFAIFDEIHWITQNNSRPFQAVGEHDFIQWKKENFVERMIGLTATPPDPKRDKLKADILNALCPVIFTYTLSEGVEDGLLPDFELIVIPVPLDNVHKVIPAGTKKKPFLTTELEHHRYLDKRVRQAQIAAQADPSKSGWANMLLFQRSRFLATLPSKAAIAKAILDKHSPGLRSLVFCGSIEQADQLFGKNVYHSKAKKPDMLAAFNAGEIDWLGVVDAMNEGQNIRNLDQAVNLSTKSNERIFIQRLGRLLRIRPNYKPRMYIIVADATQEMRWVDKVISHVPISKVRYESHRTYL